MHGHARWRRTPLPADRITVGFEQSSDARIAIRWRAHTCIGVGMTRVLGPRDARGVELPLAGDSLQCPAAFGLELDRGTDRESRNGGGHPHLVRARSAHHPRGEVHPDAAEVGATTLHLTGVDAGAYMDTNHLEVLDDP